MELSWQPLYLLDADKAEEARECSSFLSDLFLVIALHEVILKAALALVNNIMSTWHNPGIKSHKAGNTSVSSMDAVGVW